MAIADSNTRVLITISKDAKKQLDKIAVAETAVSADTAGPQVEKARFCGLLLSRPDQPQRQRIFLFN